MTDWTEADLKQNAEINKHRNVLQWIVERLDQIETHLVIDHKHPLAELVEELVELIEK